MKHFRAVHRSRDGRKGTVHEVDQDTKRDKQVDAVNINSFSVDSILSVIKAKLETSYSLNDAVI